MDTLGRGGNLTDYTAFVVTVAGYHSYWLRGGEWPHHRRNGLITSRRMDLPRLYAILDADCFVAADAMFAAAKELASAGVALIQYRNKSGSARQMLEQAQELKRLVRESAKLIMNDRTDLCVAAGFDGVHLGQDDLSPEAARSIIGTEFRGRDDQAISRPRWLGVSTHNPEQLAAADKTSADYLAIGPVFAPSSKANPDPVVGLEGVRRARGLTRKPLVAIGGITRANARSVIDVGADSVAVISDLLRAPGKSAEEFLRILR
jgi:thiamine-phosphate pyrophosphorylase